MAKILPCPRCGNAKIVENGVRKDYVIGKKPSSFGGAAYHPFLYRCAHMTKLEKSLTLTLAQWHAIPDIPPEPEPEPKEAA